MCRVRTESLGMMRVSKDCLLWCSHTLLMSLKVVSREISEANTCRSLCVTMPTAFGNILAVRSLVIFTTVVIGISNWEQYLILSYKNPELKWMIILERFVLKV